MKQSHSYNIIVLCLIIIIIVLYNSNTQKTTVINNLTNKVEQCQSNIYDANDRISDANSYIELNNSAIQELQYTSDYDNMISWIEELTEIDTIDEISVEDE
jgi:hypothetical protein